MATDAVDSMSMSETDDQGFSQPPKAALLLVIGEPLSDEHRNLILAEITTGFKCWDTEATGIDINEELAQIANRASLGEEGPNADDAGKVKGGERTIRHRSDNVAVEILVNPQAQTVRRCLKGFLKVACQLKFLLYAGHAFQGSGAWVLQDDVFTFSNFVHIFKDTDVENALKQQEDVNLVFYSLADGDWSASINKQDFSKILKIKVNPPEKLDNVHGVLQFTAYVSSFVKAQSLNSLLSSSDVVGNIRFNKPTLYIFPGCQGDSALFGISGFSLLVNGGYNRKACFWDFTRHLDRIDAVLLTHLGTDNLFGLGSVLQRKSVENVHPEIGFMYLNSSEKTRSSPAPSVENLKDKDPSLLINLAEEGNRIIEYSKQLGQFPHPCSRSVVGQQQEPVNLYHKVGHGSLDMFILNPVQDSKELKEFYQQWNKQVSNFGINQQFPLPNMLSICALLVWRPANPTEKITRIFFPGNAPQNKIIEGLERIKHLNFLKHPSCCQKDLNQPPKKAAGNARPATKPAPRSTPVKTESPRKSETPKPERSRPLSSPASKGNKISKEDTNKKTAKSKDVKKDDKEKEKTDKAKSSTSSSPSKSSVKSASSPSKSPVEPIAPVAAAIVETPPQEGSLIDTSFPAEPLVNHINGDATVPEPKPEVDETPLMKPEQIEALQSEVRESDSPEPLPNPVQYEAEPVNSAPETTPVDAQPPYDRQKLAELGIYDDDDEEEEEAEEANGSLPTEPVTESPAGTPEEPEEIEQPQSLPEPVEVPDQSHFVSEPDLIQETTQQKEALPEVESQADTVTADPDIVPNSEEPAVQDDTDPAEEIPSSPELTEEQQGFSFSKDADSPLEPTPQFTQEPDVVPVMQGQHVSLEQSIQYGITDDNGRHMGGIKEEEEDEEVESGRDSEEKQLADDPSREESLELERNPSPEPADKLPDPVRESPEPIEQSPEPEPADKLPDPVRDSPDPIEQSPEPEPADKLPDPVRESPEPIEQSPEPEPVEQTLEPVHSSPEPEAEEKPEGQFGEREDQFGEGQEEQVVPVAEEKSNIDKQSMEEMGIYDEEEDDDMDQAEERDPDAFVYEKDVDLGDEEGPQETRGSSEEQEAEVSGFEKEDVTEVVDQAPPTGSIPVDERYADYDQQEASRASESPEKEADEVQRVEESPEHEEFQRDSIEREQELQESSNIPEAFEKDETPTPGESLSLDNQTGDQQSLATDSAVASDIQDDVGSNIRDDTDSIDGGTPDDDKDIDESFAKECDAQKSEAAVVNGSSEQDLIGIEDPPANIRGMEASSNPFDSLDQQGQNPFVGIDQTNQPGQTQGSLNPFSDQSPFEPENKKQPEGFDPLGEWGQPMGLPSPPPLDDSKSASPSNGKTTKASKTTKNGAKAAEVKKADLSKSSTGTKKAPEKRPATTKTTTNKTANGPSKTEPKAKTARPTEKKAEPKKPAPATTKAPTRTRPATAPARVEPAKTTRAAPARRPATATSRSSPSGSRGPPLPPLTAFYVDLTYIPNHGDPAYSDVEFFKRIRARYYVLSALSPNPQILNSLLEAKKTWEDKDLEVTVIPTYDNETLRHWMGLHKEDLGQLKIDVAPSASRCTIQLQDHETSCSAYRLEF
ncbi:microtubule-associated protein futsch-like isoform X1 [Haliotis rufescens]|uniref:microtubule-associated protein futsch-like isoform X1 n=1 Tax=Haliotis rufescens TaxID=6454 RepID=UPI00201E86CD|nr:microtubule-associated protein futsch-like isoform X1 [Haliotis rufescens]